MAAELARAPKSADLDLESLAHMYEITDPEDVASYLDKRPAVVPILGEARAAIDRFFAAGNPARMVMFYEPEGGERSDMRLSRLDSQQLQEWLKDYRLGQIWLKGAIGGTRW